MTLTLWPEFLANLTEFQALAHAQDGALAEAVEAVRTAPDNFYMETLPPEGASRWEAMLGLSTGAGNDLPTRRFRLLTYTTPQTPFTLQRLRQMLEGLCGAGYSSAELSDDGKTLVVRVGLQSKENFPPVAALVDRVVPANLVLDVSLQYNTHAFLSVATHQQLGDHSYRILKEEVRESWLPTQQT